MAGRLCNVATAGFVAAAISGAMLVGAPAAIAAPDAASGSDSSASQSAAESAPTAGGRPAKAENRSKGDRLTERPRGDKRTGTAVRTPKAPRVKPAPEPDPATAPDAVALAAPEQTDTPRRAARKQPASAPRVYRSASPHLRTVADLPQRDPVAAPKVAVTHTVAAVGGPDAAPTAPPPSASPEPVDIAMSAPASAEVTEVATRKPTLLNVIGSVVLNLIVGLIRLVDGPPILPPNSTVTVRTSSLVLPIGAGRSVEANWYFPENVDDSTRLIYLQHGFLASAPMYSYTAARLAERTNSIVVAPSMSSNFFDPGAVWLGGSALQRAVANLFVGDRSALTESASAAAGYAVTLPEKFVLVGHSAGGTLVTAAAGYMTENGAVDDLAGVVLLDGVEVSGSHAVSDALAKLRGVNDRPIYLMSSLRYFWNRNGDMADKLRLARPDQFTGVGLTGGLHIDYLQGGNLLLQVAEYAVAGFSDPRNIDAAGLIAAGWINDLFDGTSTGVYGSAGQSIPVSTPAGTATAVVFPLGQPESNLLSALVNGFFNAILDFAGVFAVFDPMTPEPQTASVH